MMLTSHNLEQLSQQAIKAAQKAAKIINEYANKEVKVESKTGGENLASQIVTVADRLSQEVILEELQSTFQTYNLGLLTEESEDDHSRFTKEYFWCIDPLDGTLPFTEKKKGYSVSIALISKTGIPQIGVVFNPVNNKVLHAVRGVGVYENGQPVKMQDLKKTNRSFTLIIDKSFRKHRLFQKTKAFFENLSSEQELRIIDTGGAVLNACWVLENNPACYVKFPKKATGGGSLWDFAATTCIFNELDAIVCNLDNQALNLNQASTFMNKQGVLFCTSPSISKAVQDFYHENKDGFLI
ncbi:inositol monophosphatase family protein [Cytophagaceae bacterium ABcell3]|nr:inositol monophosphatase family protein [Cytophagaceae bacterium ABcell3]